MAAVRTDGFDPAMRAEYEYELAGVGRPSPKLAGS